MISAWESPMARDIATAAANKRIVLIAWGDLILVSVRPTRVHSFRFERRQTPAMTRAASFIAGMLSFYRTEIGKASAISSSAEPVRILIPPPERGTPVRRDPQAVLVPAELEIGARENGARLVP